MQMIRPTHIGDDELASSNAPVENLDFWAPDSIQYFDAEITAIDWHGDKLAFATAGGDVWIYDYSIDLNFKVSGINPSTSEPVVQLKWSPDGLRIAAGTDRFLRIYAVSTYSVDSLLIDIERGGDPELSGSMTPQVAWIDDQSRVAAAAAKPIGGDQFRTELIVIDTSDWSIIHRSDESVVSTGSGELSAQFPRGIGWSSDGGQIFYAAGSLGPSSIVTVDASTFARTVDEYNEIIFLDAEPGGTRLAVARNANISDGGIRILNQSDKTETANQPSRGLTVNEVRWSKDGSELYGRYSNSPTIARFDTTDMSDLPMPEIGSAAFAEGTASRQRVAPKNGVLAFGHQEDGFQLVDLSVPELIVSELPFYSEGDRVRYRRVIYEALTGTQSRPDEGADLSPPEWLRVGPVNPLRMFDGSVSSQTTADGLLEVSIAPGALVNGLALFNVSGATVRVKMEDPEEGEVYDSDEVELIDNATVTDWYSYFFEPYIELTEIALTDLPPYPDATITITVDAQGSEAAVGQVVMGSLFRIGESQYGSSVGIEDFSRKRRDEFGNFDIVERGYSDNGEFDVHIESNRTAGVKNVLSRFRATPAVYIGAEAKPSSIIYGFYFDFDVVYSNFSVDECAITIEGLQ